MIDRKGLLKNSIGFIVGFAIILILIDMLSFTEVGDEVLGRVFFATGYREIGSAEICPSIYKAEEKNNYSKIILGDSVCHQIFNEFQESNDEYLLLGTNQAITMDGQYILAKLFLESHPNATDIYLVMLPNAFTSGYESEMTYSYLIEPFGKTGKLNMLSEQSLDNMTNLYGKVFMERNVIRFIDGSCINNKLYLFHNQNSSDFTESHNNRIMSPEAVYYLNDLERICLDSGVVLHVLPCPVVDTVDNHNLVEHLREEVVQIELENLFSDYFACITFYPQYMFQDGTHFGGEFASVDTYSICINDLKQKSDQLEGLMY